MTTEQLYQVLITASNGDTVDVFYISGDDVTDALDSVRKRLLDWSREHKVKLIQHVGVLVED